MDHLDGRDPALPPVDSAAPPYPNADFAAFFRLPVGGVVGDSFSSYFTNFFKYTFICVLAMSPAIVWGVVVLSDLDIFDKYLMYNIIGISLAAVLLQPIATGAIIYGVFRKQRGQSAPLGKCLAVGLGRLFHLLGVAVLTFLGMAAICAPIVLVLFLPVIGIILALAGVIPIMMFFCAVYAAAPAVVVERIGVIEAFSRSFKLTRGNRMRIFGVILVLGLVQQVIGWVLEKVMVDPKSLAGLGDLDSIVSNFQINIGITLFISVAFAAIGAIASALVYYHLKVQTEGVDETELASVFD